MLTNGVRVTGDEKAENLYLLAVDVAQLLDLGWRSRRLEVVLMLCGH